MNKIFFGLNNFYDVTDICLLKCIENNKIIIPKGNKVKYRLFGFMDGSSKNKIKIILNGNQKIYNSNEKVILNVNDFYDKDIFKLKDIHNNIKIEYGSIYDELPEQIMSVKYINSDDKVLEIGGNIGRNSIIISKLLNNDKNLVVLETDLNNVRKLEKNKINNNCNFHIEPSALSENRLIQNNWNTRILNDNEEIPRKWFEVNTIKLGELNSKYNIDFNVLVLDCEGAFYNILISYPKILKNINKIIIENDFKNKNQFIYFKNKLLENGFNLVYNKNLQKKDFIKKDFYHVWLK